MVSAHTAVLQLPGEVSGGVDGDAVEQAAGVVQVRGVGVQAGADHCAGLWNGE